MTSTQQALDLLARMTTAAPAGVWSAPGRVNLIGEHTDYNNGFVLPFAIAQRTYAAVAVRDDRQLRVRSTFTEETVEISLDSLDTVFPTPTGSAPAIAEWAAYPLGVAWALLHPHDTNAPDATRLTGLDIALASDVPVGAGLSSSAAIECATAVAMNDLWQLGVDRRGLAQAGRRAENFAVGAPTGIMDQMASMLGESDAALFLDCRSLHTEIVPLGFAEANLELLVIDTRVKHSHATGGYGERRASCEKGAAALGVPMLRDVSVTDLDRARSVLDDETFRRVRHIVTENDRVLHTVETLRMYGPSAIGELLTASHASMRDDFEISCTELDLAVDTALQAGAHGARMTGGGFGGAAIALVDHTTVDAVSQRIHETFTAAGFTEPHLFTVVPADGAAHTC